VGGALGHGGGALSLVSLVKLYSRRRRGVQRVTSDIRRQRQRGASQPQEQCSDRAKGPGAEAAGEDGMRRASMCSVSGMR
jgi:hypothetical protein